MPTTPEHIARLAARAREGVPLHQPGDPPLHFGRLENGRVRAEPGPAALEKKVFAEANTFSKSTKRLSTLNIQSLANLGARLRDARRAVRLSFGQVATLTGIGRSTIHDLETGRHSTPTLAVLWGLADCYGLTLDQLVGRVA